MLDDATGNAHFISSLLPSFPPLPALCSLGWSTWHEQFEGKKELCLIHSNIFNVQHSAGHIGTQCISLTVLAMNDTRFKENTPSLMKLPYTWQGLRPVAQTRLEQPYSKLFQFPCSSCLLSCSFCTGNLPAFLADSTLICPLQFNWAAFLSFLARTPFLTFELETCLLPHNWENLELSLFLRCCLQKYCSLTWQTQWHLISL